MDKCLYFNGRSLATGNLPTGAVNLTTSEDLAAGDFVHVFDVSGTPTACKADAGAAQLLEAHGFVKADSTSGNPAEIFPPGSLNDHLTGLTAGPLYLSATTPGGVTATPPQQRRPDPADRHRRLGDLGIFYSPLADCIGY